MRPVHLYLRLLLLWACLTHAQAAAPTNDVCSGAENIPLNPVFPYLTVITDITLATTNGDPPTASCVFGDVSRSIWYKFTPKATAFYTISSCANAPSATTLPDTVMAIYTSSSGCGGATNELPSNATTIGCDNDSCGPGFSQAAITSQLLADTTYYIVVWQNGTAPPVPGTSTVQLRISKPTPPANDRSAGAAEVFLNLPVIGTTILSQDDYELPLFNSCFSGIGQRSSTASGRDVVYAFTAPEDGNYSIKADHYNNSTIYDLILYAAGSLPAGPSPQAVTDCLAGANRNPASSAEEILCLPLNADQQIYIVVDEDVFSPEGSGFVVEVTRCRQESETNNTWTAAGVPFFGVEGSIRPANDVDFYWLGTFPPGARAFAMIDGSAANIPDFQVRVIGVSDTLTNMLEYDHGNNDELFGGLSSNIAGTPLTNGAAYLRINHLQGAIAEPYRLYAVVEPPLAAATLEKEPNNSLAQATSADNNYFYGSLTSAVPNTVSTDVDIYAFSVEAVDGISDLLFLSLDCDPLRNNTPINGKLELLDASGNVLVSVDDENSTSSTNSGSVLPTAPFSPGEALVYRTLADGTYYARVSISPGANTVNGSGDYLLSISRNGFIGSCGCNNPPALSKVAITSPTYQNGPATLSGSIIDYDLAQWHQVTVNWGDGSSITTTNLPPGANLFHIPHTYLKANANVSISLAMQDDAGGAASTNITVTVQPQPMTPQLLSITQSAVDGHIVLALQGSPGIAYRVQTSNDLIVWTELNSSTADANGFFQIEDTTLPLLVQRFYRALWP